jgi:hypothetical protein
MLKLIPTAASVLLLAACGGLSKQMEEPKDSDRSLVYGYVDMTDGPCWMDWFSMKQVLPKVEKPYLGFRVCDGAFYAEYIPLGSFQLSHFGGTKTLGNTIYTFNFPQQLPGLRIEKPGLYYVGAFKMKEEGNFFKSKYDIDLAEKPTEREVIEKILPYAKGTEWDDWLRRRLKELK